MVEVFITNIQSKNQAETILMNIKNENADLKINLEPNETAFPFPCGHTILRIEGNQIDPENIITKIGDFGFKCEILEDKICIQTEKT